MNSINILSRWTLIRLIPALATLQVLVGVACAQVEEEWSRTYGGRWGDACYSIIQTGDGGYALAGHSISLDNASDSYLLRINSEGEIIWANSFGGRLADYCFSAVQTADGGFALAGYTQSFGPGIYDFWLVRTNSDGDSLWARNFGGDQDEYCQSIIQTADEGFALAGYTNSFGAGGDDFWLLRTDANGDSLWSRSFGGGNDDRCFDIVATDDGGFILAGYTESFGSGASDFWLLRTNSDGDSLWSRTFGDEGHNNCNAIIATADEGYALAGYSYHAPRYNDFWLVKTNEDGDSLWSRYYIAPSFDNCAGIMQTADGGFALLGTILTNRNFNELMLVRTDPKGDSLYTMIMGGENYDFGQSIVQAEDGGFMLAGYTNSYGAGGNDFWLIKTTPDPVIAHAIPLVRGWNILSSVCQPANAAIPAVWSDIVAREHLFMAKDQLGNFYLPGQDFNNMPPWDVRQGYMAKLTDPDTLVIVNQSVAADTPIPLLQSWNIVSYLPEAEVAAPEAFANLGEALIIAKDELGNFYLPRINFSNLGNLRRGKGYQVNVTQDMDLVWNVQGRRMENGKWKMEPEAIANVQTVHFVHPAPTGRNMSVLLNLEFRMQNVEYEIGAFTESGLCVGSTSTLTSTSTFGLAVWGDDPTTPGLDGAVEGETLTFRLWDGRAETVVLPDWEEGEGTYQTDGFAMGTLDAGAHGNAPIPMTLTLEPPYPNPFNARASLRFGLTAAGRASLTLYDLSGRSLFKLVDNSFAAGWHQATFDAENLAAGVYWARLESGGSSRTVKAVVVK